jgi:hypothetical protein
MNKLSKLIAKIKALLALATSPNEHEAASAAEKAATLLAEHNLELADLKQASQPVVDFDPELIMIPEVWRRLIGKALGQLYFSHYILSEVRGWDAHGFVGAEHNVKVAKLMFVYVVKAIVMRAQEASLKRPEKGRKEYYDSFATAAAMRINARIQKRIAAAAAGYLSPNAGTTLPALVSLYERTARELTLFVEQELGASAEQQPVETLDPLGALHGTIAGNEIGLDTQIKNETPVAKLIG